jgi:2-hydroxychromene-2-carboxylate isomerase
MQRVTFWLDFISPYAHLAFERLPQALQGCSYEVDYRPVLFAGLLQHHAHKGPAEIEPKRAWTFRQVHWLAAQHGIAMDTPLRHPFNPLPLLRLALACGPNRRVVEAIFHHVWQRRCRRRRPRPRGRAAGHAGTGTRPGRGRGEGGVEGQHREAIARGVFGVPSFGLGGRVFWGLDALPMLAGALQGDAWFDGPAWDREGAPRAGVVRR